MTIFSAADWRIRCYPAAHGDDNVPHSVDQQTTVFKTTTSKCLVSLFPAMVPLVNKATQAPPEKRVQMAHAVTKATLEDPALVVLPVRLARPVLQAHPDPKADLALPEEADPKVHLVLPDRKDQGLR